MASERARKFVGGAMVLVGLFQAALYATRLDWVSIGIGIFYTILGGDISLGGSLPLQVDLYSNYC